MILFSLCHCYSVAAFTAKVFCFILHFKINLCYNSQTILLWINTFPPIVVITCNLMLIFTISAVSQRRNSSVNTHLQAQDSYISRGLPVVRAQDAASLSTVHTWLLYINIMRHQSIAVRGDMRSAVITAGGNGCMGTIWSLLECDSQPVKSAVKFCSISSHLPHAGTLVTQTTPSVFIPRHIGTFPDVPVPNICILSFQRCPMVCRG